MPNERRARADVGDDRTVRPRAERTGDQEHGARPHSSDNHEREPRSSGSEKHSPRGATRNSHEHSPRGATRNSHEHSPRGATRNSHEHSLRADARDNRERILRAAKAEFTEQGAHASLNRIAQRAGVGPGTLYRHFPNQQTLLVAIIANDVDQLCATGQTLLGHDSPDAALRDWLRAVAVHATAMRGLVAVEMAAVSSESLAGCHDAITATGTALLDRAHRAGAVAKDIRIADLLALVNAVAWASEQAENPQLLDRLLHLVDRGLHA